MAAASVLPTCNVWTRLCWYRFPQVFQFEVISTPTNCLKKNILFFSFPLLHFSGGCFGIVYSPVSWVRTSFHCQTQEVIQFSSFSFVSETDVTIRLMNKRNCKWIAASCYKRHLVYLAKRNWSPMSLYLLLFVLETSDSGNQKLQQLHQLFTSRIQSHRLPVIFSARTL